MTPENFVYWLQGYFELNDAYTPPTSPGITGPIKWIGPDQIQVIKDHLKLVLDKQTPCKQPSLQIVDTNGLISSADPTNTVYWNKYYPRPTGEPTPFIPGSC